MALDVYVMPLWRFKAGEFASPIEAATGIKPSVVCIDALPSLPWHIRLLLKLGIVSYESPEAERSPEESRKLAKYEVRQLKKNMSKDLGVPVDWEDDGEIHYNKQFFHPVILRAFAAWLAYRDTVPEFEAAPEGNYYEHPIWKIAKRPHRRFPTLIRHSLHVGYFLPLAFEGHFETEPFEAWRHKFTKSVASSQTILRELDELLLLFDSVVSKDEDGKQRIADAKWYAEELRRICLLSIEHRLPVIFHG